MKRSVFFILLAICCVSCRASDDEAVEKMAQSPGVGYSTMRPGWVKVDYDEDMNAVKACGKGVWIKLLKKIGQLDNITSTEPGKKQDEKQAKTKKDDEEPGEMTRRKEFLLKVSAIAADLEIKELVPVLFSYLEDRDDAFNDILAVKIGTILKLPDQYHYHRHWFDQETRTKFRDEVGKCLEAK